MDFNELYYEAIGIVKMINDYYPERLDLQTALAYSSNVNRIIAQLDMMMDNDDPEQLDMFMTVADEHCAVYYKLYCDMPETYIPSDSDDD